MGDKGEKGGGWHGEEEIKESGGERSCSEGDGNRGDIE